MRICSSSWKAIVLSGAITLVGSAGPLIATASAAPPPLTSVVNSSPSSFAVATGASANCSTPTISQPFLAWNDAGWYALAPGESPDQFNGSGWNLGGGASVQTATLLDSTTSSVLDIPAGGFAISPPICVASDYPTARTLVRGSAGANIMVGAVYANSVGPGATATNLKTRMSGSFAGGPQWAPSSPFRIHPGPHAGWQLVQFVFVNAGASGDAQLYDFYIDPRFSN